MGGIGKVVIDRRGTLCQLNGQMSSQNPRPGPATGLGRWDQTDQTGSIKWNRAPGKAPWMFWSRPL